MELQPVTTRFGKNSALARSSILPPVPEETASQISGGNSDDPDSPGDNPEPAPYIAVVDDSRVIGLTEEEVIFYQGFTKARRRSIRTKIDLRLLPVLCLLYLFAQLDRANIGNAKIEGLKEDTHMTDRQYNIVLAMFFLPYCLLEVPSNMILRRFKRPSVYIAALVQTWGVVMTCHGFAKDFKSMFILRFLLGAAEAGFFPAATFICSQWYHPLDLAFRLSLFMVVSAASGISSGLLAAAITKMDGVCGLEGWRWIFILEGVATVVIGFGTWFALVDTPALAQRWLSEDERRFLMIQNLVKSGGTLQEEKECKTTPWWKDLWSILSQVRYWAFGSIFHAGGACAYGLKFAMPSIIHGMGYSRSQAQLLSTIPYIFGVLSAITAAVGSDFLACRSIFVCFGFTFIITGLSIVMKMSQDMTANPAAMMAGLSFITAGVLPLAPTGGSWVSNNIRHPGRRAVGLAFTMAMGSLGGLTGSFMYDESETPVFVKGYLSSLGLAVTALLATGGLLLYFVVMNRRRSLVSEDEVKEKYSEAQLLEMGEESPFFEYTI